MGAVIASRSEVFPVTYRQLLRGSVARLVLLADCRGGLGGAEFFGSLHDVMIADRPLALVVCTPRKQARDR